MRQLTIADRCTPTPLSIGHAGYCIGSWWCGGVSCITGVGPCGLIGCTRATALAICRSSRWTTTGDGCWGRVDVFNDFGSSCVHANVLY